MFVCDVYTDTWLSRLLYAVPSDVCKTRTASVVLRTPCRLGGFDVGRPLQSVCRFGHRCHTSTVQCLLCAVQVIRVGQRRHMPYWTVRRLPSQ